MVPVVVVTVTATESGALLPLSSTTSVQFPGPAGVIVKTCDGPVPVEGETVTIPVHELVGPLVTVNEPL